MGLGSGVLGSLCRGSEKLPHLLKVWLRVVESLGSNRAERDTDQESVSPPRGKQFSVDHHKELSPPALGKELNG